MTTVFISGFKQASSFLNVSMVVSDEELRLLITVLGSSITSPHSSNERFRIETCLRSSARNTFEYLHSMLRLVYRLGKYILLSKLTTEGRKTLKERPERIREVNREIESFGVKVLEQYAVLGPYDFINIVEAPDNDAIFRVSVELGSRGTIEIMSMPATPVDKLVATLKK